MFNLVNTPAVSSNVLDVHMFMCITSFIQAYSNRSTHEVVAGSDHRVEQIVLFSDRTYELLSAFGRKYTCHMFTQLWADMPKCLGLLNIV